MEAMHALELKMHDLAAILGPIDEATREANRVPLIEMQLGERDGPGGRKRSVRNVVMDREVAEMVRVAERKAREIEPHPLDRDVG